MNNKIYERLCAIFPNYDLISKHYPLSGMIKESSWKGSGLYSGDFLDNKEITYLILANSFSDATRKVAYWLMPIDQFKKMVKDTISLLKDFEDFHC